MDSYSYDNDYVLLKDELIVREFIKGLEDGRIFFNDDHVFMIKQLDPCYPEYVYNPVG